MRPQFAAHFFLLISSTIPLIKLSYCTIGNNSLVCPEIEKEALLSFKLSLEDPSNLLSSWNMSADVNCCNWKGVVCSNITGGGRVHQLRLQSYDRTQGLRGKIDPSLLNLKHLRYLDLSQNNFEETIPSFIGSITSLEYLNLSHAGFYGAIPSSIGNLSNLRVLSLEDDFGSRLMEVNGLDWVSGLSQLEYINMNQVNLSRAPNWLKVIDTVPSLVELHFAFCSLDFNNNNDDVVNISTSLAIVDLPHNTFRSFDILKWTFQLSNLNFLDLSYNYFEGPIPTTTNTTKLRHVDLSMNYFNSTIPDWLYYCKHLEFVSMRFNYLQGPLSDDIANLTSLNTLFLNSNQLSGEIPRGIIANLCKMQTLYLCYNYFQGDLSYSFGNMSGCFSGASGFLKAVHLGGNILSGSIPINIGKMSSLEYLHLGGNKLTGNLPESVGQLSNLEFLSVEDNKLEGVVSEIHFANLTKLKRLFASSNHFMTLNVSTNWIPHFELEVLALGSWNLGIGARIPTWLETQKRNIYRLDLSNTGISGIVPSWMWKIGTLNLSHNNLHGNIPVINERTSSIYFIFLNSNRFSGSLPQMPATVLDLDLSNNSFSGELSHFLCNITPDKMYAMQILHLGGNRLSGEIPDCWMKWLSLTYLNLGNNMLSGNIPNSIGYLTRLRSLNLYNNEISGQIPFSMRNCSALVRWTWVTMTSMEAYRHGWGLA